MSNIKKKYNTQIRMIKAFRNYRYGTDDYLSAGLIKEGFFLPPCKVGDIVYCLINEDNELDRCSKHYCTSTVTDFSFEKRGDKQLLLVHLDFNNTDINARTLIEFVDDVFGETVFLTVEDVKTVIKERGE